MRRRLLQLLDHLIRYHRIPLHNRSRHMRILGRTRLRNNKIPFLLRIPMQLLYGMVIGSLHPHHLPPIPHNRLLPPFTHPIIHIQNRPTPKDLRPPSHRPPVIPRSSRRDHNIPHNIPIFPIHQISSINDIYSRNFPHLPLYHPQHRKRRPRRLKTPNPKTRPLVLTPHSPDAAGLRQPIQRNQRCWLIPGPTANFHLRLRKRLLIEHLLLRLPVLHKLPRLWIDKHLAIILPHTNFLC